MRRSWAGLLGGLWLLLPLGAALLPGSAAAGTVNVAISNSSGFGGQNAVLVFTEC